jgi:hypothetical protein
MFSVADTRSHRDDPPVFSAEHPYPFTTPNDWDWLELRRHLGRDPLDPLSALEPILDAVAPSWR